MTSWNLSCTTTATHSTTTAELDLLSKVIVIVNVFKMDLGRPRFRPALRSRARTRPSQRMATHCDQSSNSIVRRSGQQFRAKRFSSDAKSVSRLTDLPNPNAWRRVSGMWTNRPVASQSDARIHPLSTTPTAMQMATNSFI